MSLNINCQYCNKYLFCTHPTRSKFLGIFKRQCAIATGQLAIGQRCDLQKVFPEPDIKIGKKNESKKIKLERMDSLVKGAWIEKPKEAPILKKKKKEKKKMEIEKVVKAIEEAERFIGKAKLALKRAEGRKYFYIAKENASCRRASLDLTRALAELRKY